VTNTLAYNAVGVIETSIKPFTEHALRMKEMEKNISKIYLLKIF
jgi:hypothetical protein